MPVSMTVYGLIQCAFWIFHKYAVPVSKLFAILTNYMQIFVLGCSCLLKLNPVVVGCQLLDLATTASAREHRPFMGYAHANAITFQPFAVPVSRLASNLKYFIHFFVLGCTCLLKLNPGVYGCLLLVLATTVTPGEYCPPMG